MNTNKSTEHIASFQLEKQDNGRFVNPQYRVIFSRGVAPSIVGSWQDSAHEAFNAALDKLGEILDI